MLSISRNLMKASLAMVAASLMFSTTAIAGESYQIGTLGLLSPNTLGALVASPFLTEDNETRITVTTITNTSGVKPINLHMIWLASGQEWREINRDCVVTPRETTYVIMHTTGGSTFADYECSSPNLSCTESTCNQQKQANLLSKNGTLFVAPECAPGPFDQQCLLHDKEFRTIDENLLRSDFTVIDFAGGYAFSAPALHIQASIHDSRWAYGDRWYKFNGRPGEYKQFPSMLTGSYIATDDNLTAEVILMNLDGTPSDGAPAKVAGDIYDDDEDAASGNFEFDCMEVLDLGEAWLNFPDSSNGHTVGHFEIGSIAVPYPGTHDVISSNGDSPNVRVAAVHGYIVQVSSSDFPNEGAPGFNGTGAWARQLTQSTNMLPRAPGDVPSLYGMGSVPPRRLP